MDIGQETRVHYLYQLILNWYAGDSRLTCVDDIACARHFRSNLLACFRARKHRGNEWQDRQQRESWPHHFAFDEAAAGGLRSGGLTSTLEIQGCSYLLRCFRELISRSVMDRRPQKPCLTIQHRKMLFKVSRGRRESIHGTREQPRPRGRGVI